MNENVSNDKLKISLFNIKLQDDEDTVEEFKTSLLSSVLLVPVEITDKTDEYNLVLLNNPDGDSFFQAYTDEEAYELWVDKDKYQTVYFSFDEYANFLLNNEEVTGLVLNPFSENVSLSRDYVHEIYISDKISIETMEETPKDLADDFSKILKDLKDVNKAFLLKMTKHGIEGYLLVVDVSKVSKKNRKNIFEKIGKRAIKDIEKLNLEITDTDDEDVKPIIKDLSPFYKR